jgi:carbamoyl-phosphate synthase small subunit
MSLSACFISPIDSSYSFLALALADGTVFHRHSIGATGHTTGEVVFNTALTGYQEILTDPSYCQQIVTLTYPHIGNYGVNAEDVESRKVYAAGLIIRDLPLSLQLPQRPRRCAVPAARGHGRHRQHRHAQADALLRTKGAQNGCIVALGAGHHSDAEWSPTRSRKARRAEHGRPGPRQGRERAQARDRVGARQPATASSGAAFHVVAYDYGVKRNILRMLAERGCKVTVVPAQTTAEDAGAEARRRLPVQRPRRSGAVRLRDRGDPRTDRARHPDLRHLPRPPDAGARSGAKTFKMKFGHHGANHPVKDLDTGKVEITSQNHGFAVDERRCRRTAATHVSLFDGTLPCQSAPTSKHPDHRRRPDRHRPGLRVRLLRHAGLQGAARGGLPVVLVNSNPATIMTDPEMADAPTSSRSPGGGREDHREGAPDALLPTMGGQTALNCALDLHKHGVLEKYGVEMIGANAEAIDKAEDREKFKDAMTKIGLDVAQERHRALARGGAPHRRSDAVGCPHHPPASRWAAPAAASPTTARSSIEIVRARPRASPDHEVLIEES